MNKRLVIWVFLFALLSCDERGDTYDFQTSPHIEFVSLEFVNVEGGQDSLKLTTKIWDEENDLGLWSNERDYPYHDYDIIVDSVAFGDGPDSTPTSARIVTLSAEEVYLPFYLIDFHGDFYEDTFSEVDNRPEYSCKDYDTLRLNASNTGFIFPGSDFPYSGFNTDTVFISRNPNRYNMTVDFYMDFSGNGDDRDNFELLEWEYIFDEDGCGFSYDARFPILSSGGPRGSSPFRVSNFNGRSPHTLTYSMLSLGFNHILGNHLFKLKIQIKDRELNESNVLETPAFTLQEIRQN